MLLVNVKTENANDGCFKDSFATLDEVRDFIKARAASFRNGSQNKELKCEATILRNGTSLNQARVIAC